MSATVRVKRTLVLQTMLIAAGLAAVLFFTLVAPTVSVRQAHFVPATLGDEPPGAVVLGREDGALAVGLAIAPGRGALLLVATVWGQSGAGLGGLKTSFTVTTSDRHALSADGTPCTAGCYEATVRAGGRPTTATVVLNGGNRVRFTLPRQWPAAPAGSLVRKAAAEYGQVRSLVTHERLASSLTQVVYTTYYAVAPDKLRYQIRDGAEAIIIGDQRWDRQPGGAWERSPQDPIRPITPYWAPLIQDARIIGEQTVHGRPCWIVAFADPQTPGFFTIWIDKSTYRTLQLQMTAAGHFMYHSYGQFDAPLAINPPTNR
jgi:hypothetical protein